MNGDDTESRNNVTLRRKMKNLKFFLPNHEDRRPFIQLTVQAIVMLSIKNAFKGHAFGLSGSG